MRCATFDCRDEGFGFPMAKVAASLAVLGLIFVLLGGLVAPALAGSASCVDGLTRSKSACADASSQEFTAQKKRTRVVIYGRRTNTASAVRSSCRRCTAGGNSRPDLTFTSSPARR